jgi:hypothetical protein
MAIKLLAWIPLTQYFSFVAGGAVSKVDPSSTGLHPAWRNCLWEATFGTAWDEGIPFNEIKRLRAGLATIINEVSDIMPGAGSYLNEVCTPAHS